MNKEPKYRVIMERFESKIRDGELKNDDILPSEAEISKEYSVSNITARRVMNELEKIKLISRRKGKGSFVSYFPEPKIKGKSSLNIIALIMPHSTSIGRSLDIIQGLTDALSKNGYYLTIHISDEDVDKEREIINHLIMDGVSGIILNPVSHIKNIDLINRLILHQIPLITIDKHFEGMTVSSVLTDNFKGSYDAVSHLIELGHKEIAFICDTEIGKSTTVRDRYLGYCKALKDNDIPIKDENLFNIKYLNNERIMEALKAGDMSWGQLLGSVKTILEGMKNRKKSFTAIHTVHDYLAIYILKVALELGIKVPQELSIIGFDNIENCAYVEVPLTSVEYSFVTIGEKCAQLIMEKINDPLQEHKKILIPVKLVIRDSVSSPD